MQLADFRYDLPRELIAQRPLDGRTDSRLLVLPHGDESCRHLRFRDITSVLRPDDVLVVNDTQVIKARLMGRKPTGGRVEVFIERVLSERIALCLLRANRAPKPGQRILVDSTELVIGERAGPMWEVRFDAPVDTVLERSGDVPLPPYIERSAAEIDATRYQTVYARSPGAVAAPTAGLHFDTELLGAIADLGVRVVPITLHVGAGTFMPVRVDDIRQHEMHAERYHIGAAAREAIDACAGRVVAVGTTVVRTLEAAAASGSDAGETQLFITPGFEFRVVDAMVTNFHLPESTLLMLVAAFVGRDRVLDAYREAVDAGYRFFSYGDAMFCER